MSENEPIFSVLSGKDCCTGNLNISGMPIANGCYTYVGPNQWIRVNEGQVVEEAFMSMAWLPEAIVRSLIVRVHPTLQDIVAILYYGQNPSCPITGTYPIATDRSGGVWLPGGGNATIVCGC